MCADLTELEIASITPYYINSLLIMFVTDYHDNWLVAVAAVIYFLTLTNSLTYSLTACGIISS